MNLSQSQPAEEQILLTVTDQSKLDLVMELLSHFDLVRAERVKSQSSDQPQPTASTEPAGSEADFWALAGIWKDWDIDLEKMRQESFERRTKHYDR